MTEKLDAANNDRHLAFTKGDLDLMGEKMSTELQKLADLLEDHEWVYKIENTNPSELVDYIASVVPELRQHVETLKDLIEKEDYAFEAIGDPKHFALVKKAHVFNNPRLYKARPLLSHVLYGLAGWMQYFIDKRHSEIISARADKRTPMGREKKFYRAHLNVVDPKFKSLSAQVWGAQYLVASIREAGGKTSGVPSSKLIDDQDLSELLTLDFVRPEVPVRIGKKFLSDRLKKVIVKMEIFPREYKPSLLRQSVRITDSRPHIGVCFVNIFFPNISDEFRNPQVIPITLERNMGGELIFSDQLFTPIGDYFKRESIPLSEYENLRQVIQKGVMDAYLRGDLKTVEEVEQEENARANGETPNEESPQEAIENVEDVVDAQEHKIQGTIAGEPVEVTEPIINVRKHARDTLKKEASQIRQISVEEAIRAFSRAGVQIVSGGKHQKLVREGKPPLPFFNPHSEYNEALVWRVAKKAARLLGVYHAFLREVM